DAALLGLAALDFWWARSFAIRAKRRMPPKLSVGAPNRVQLSLRNHAGRTVRVAIRDDVPDHFTAAPDPIEVALPPHSRQVATYRLTPTRRGRFELGDLHLRVL